MPETLPPPPKAVPLGKVASPQAMTEGVNSLSQNLTVLPAPSEREPLAHPETLHFSQKLSRYAKGPISEGAGIEQSEMTGGVFSPKRADFHFPTLKS